MARGPVIRDVGTPFRRGTFLRAPFRNSSSKACLPTSRSSAAIRASYSWIVAAAAASSSSAPASYFWTQIRIRLRERSCRCARPCSVSPARYSCATCRLNSMLWDRCLAMGSHPPKARLQVNLSVTYCPAPGAHSTPWSSFRPADIGAEVELDLDETLFGDPLPEARHAGLKARPGERAY